MNQGDQGFSRCRNRCSSRRQAAKSQRRCYANRLGSQPLPPLYAAEALEQRLLLAVLYVDLNARGILHDGASWDSAYVDLQLALENAKAGDEIRIADGTYKPTATTDRTISFALKTGVALYGGYAGVGAPNPDARDIAAYPTILSGEIGDPNTTTDNSYHVVYAEDVDSITLLDSLIITAGNASRNKGYSDPCGYGGGMYNLAHYPTLSTPTLVHCTFVQNSALYGGGMCNYSSDPTLANPTLINCVFSKNSGQQGGGGMSNHNSAPILTGCTFTDNWACSGGGTYSYSNVSPTLVTPTFTNCTFSDNSAIFGGGMLNSASTACIVTNCTFSGNSAREGGAAENDNNSTPRFTNCILWG
ncbi:MAG TPA: right-handed parallel beta-helix repeat-containing protein, partial [Tepidisphaeraceae bacterium]|nr:right-handed parallel beta-helix repeat-containing protein [Tepidisphaeraceae bacterium]